MKEGGTMSRALMRHAMSGSAVKLRKIARFIDGRIVSGTDTAHRTVSGRKYNKLLKLYFRTHDEEGVRK